MSEAPRRGAAHATPGRRGRPDRKLSPPLGMRPTHFFGARLDRENKHAGLRESAPTPTREMVRVEGAKDRRPGERARVPERGFAGGPVAAHGTWRPRRGTPLAAALRARRAWPDASGFWSARRHERPPRGPQPWPHEP